MEIEKTLTNGLQVPDRKNQVYWTKAIILALVSVLGFGATWHLLAFGFSQNQGLLFWIYPIITASLAVVFLTFLAVVNRNKILFFITNALIFLWYVAVMPKDWFVVIGAALFFALSFSFESRIKHDEKSRADFSMSRVLRGSITVMVYALLFIVGFNIYAKATDEFKSDPKHFYNQIGHFAARGLEYVPSGLGNFNPDQRFDEFVISQAQKQEPGFNSATASQKQDLAQQVKQALVDRFHIQISGNPLLGEVVAGWVSEKVETTATNYQNYFPGIFAIIAAALLRTLAFVFVWLTQLFSWLIFKLLLKFKFFRLAKVPVEVEKLEI